MKLIFSTTNPVLARHTAATIQTRLQNLVAGMHHAPYLLGVSFVEQQNRMHIAIACVKHVDDA
jgi:hypothetical protein